MVRRKYIAECSPRAGNSFARIALVGSSLRRSSRVLEWFFPKTAEAPSAAGGPCSRAPKGRLPIAIRLRAHVKNRHGQSWDRFSIDLTVKDEHLREIEALMLRIASPPGAKQRGKRAKSRDMRRRIAAAIRLLSEAASSPPQSRKSRSVSPLPSGFPVLGVGAVADWADGAHSATLTYGQIACDPLGLMP